LNNQKNNIKESIEKTKNQLASTKTRLSISESSYQKSLTELESKILFIKY